jgi:hypothetical protein
LVNIYPKVTRLEGGGEVRQDGRDGTDVENGVIAWVVVGIGESDADGVGAEDDVAELNAMRGNNITKREVILAQEVGEVVK